MPLPAAALLALAACGSAAAVPGEEARERQSCTAQVTKAPLLVQAKTSLKSEALEDDPEGFEAVDGGSGRACRGASASDNSRSYFSVVRLGAGRSESEYQADCQLRCLARPACKGIEFNAGGRCELWTRDIGASKAAAGYSCFRLAAPRPPPRSGQFVAGAGGQGFACRGASRGDNSASYYSVVKLSGTSLEECQALCAYQPSCKGVERRDGRCELWTREIQAYKALDGFSCWRFADEDPSTSAPTMTAAPTTTVSPAPAPATARSPGLCIESKRGWSCTPCSIPCSAFVGVCRRDVAALSAMLFPPAQHCGEGGQCEKYPRSVRVAGKTFRRPQQRCVIYNKGAWLDEASPAGYCLNDPYRGHSSSTLRAAGADAVFAAAFKSSMERSGAALVCSGPSFCHGRGTASGSLGNCVCACTGGYSGVRCEIAPSQLA